MVVSQLWLRDQFRNILLSAPGLLLTPFGIPLVVVREWWQCGVAVQLFMVCLQRQSKFASRWDHFLVTVCCFCWPLASFGSKLQNLVAHIHFFSSANNEISAAFSPNWPTANINTQRFGGNVSSLTLRWGDDIWISVAVISVGPGFRTDVYSRCGCNFWGTYTVWYRLKYGGVPSGTICLSVS